MTSETPTSHSVVLASEPSAISGLCDQILGALAENGFCQDDVFAVHLAVEEAFLNAVKHGNKMDSSKTVKVEYLVDGEKIELKFTDEGEGFDLCGVPDPRCEGNLYKPHGRGVLLIRAYMDEVCYNDSGNCVKMVRYRDRERA